MENKLESHFLYPSTLYVSPEPYQVVTVLGSCVSVCLWDPILKIGGINHYMLPLWNGEGLASPKYGNIAIEKLIARMLELGSKRNQLKAKVFGGGEVIETNIASFKIGERNVIIANEMLEEHKIPIISRSTGGLLGRKIIFYTNSGDVMQKFIEKHQFNPIPEKIK